MTDPWSTPPIPTETSTVQPLEQPESYSREVELDDGGRLLVRPIQPDDKAALQEGLKQLSRDSVYRRFFSPKRELSEKELAYLTELDFHGHVGLVAIRTDTDEPEPIGVGRYIVLDPEGKPHAPCAELAITVVDEHQHRGVGGVLFDHLCAMAREQGIEAFVGTIMEGNRPMHRLLDSHGHVVDETWDGDGVRVTVRLDTCGAGLPED